MHLKKYSTVYVLTAFFLVACSEEKSSKDYIESSQSYAESGDYKSAVIEARNAVKNDTENAEARMLLGTLELRVSNPQKSEKELRKAIELGINPSEVVVDLSTALLRQGKYDEVLEVDADSVQDNAKAIVLANAATAHFSKGDVSVADELAEAALETNPKSTEALLISARSAAYKGDFLIARQSVSKALESSPEHSDSWKFMGDLEISANNSDEAIAAYSSAVNFAQNINPYLLSRAQAFMRLKRFDEASKDFRTLEKNGVKHPMVYQGKSEILFQNGEYKEAQIQQEQALKLNPEYLPAVHGITLTHLLLGNLGQAEQYAKQMLNAQDNTAARTLLGAVRLESDRYEQAEATLLPLLETRAIDPFSTRLLATAYLKQKKYEEAIEVMMNMYRSLGVSELSDTPFLALEMSPAQTLKSLDNDSAPQEPQDEPYLSSHSRKIVEIVQLLAANSTDNALAAADELLTQMPDSAAPHSLKGRAYVLSKDFDNAAKSFQTAISLAPKSTFPTVMLAEITRMQSPEKAAQLLESALADSTGSSREILMLRLANHAHQDGQANPTLDWLNRSKLENPKSIKTNLALASYHSVNGNYTEAVDSISSLNTDDQSLPYVVEMQVRALLLDKRFDVAIEKLDGFLKQTPNSNVSPSFYFMRAQAHAGVRDTEKMTADLNHAIKIDPNHAPSLLALARTKISENELDTAENHIKKLESLIPESEELNNVKDYLVNAKLTPNEGKVRIQLNNSEDVLNAVKKLRVAGETENAVRLMKTWLERNSSDTVVWSALGDTYTALERIPDAIAAYRQALESSDNNYIALNNLAWHLRKSEPENALIYARKSLEIRPDTVNALDTLALILLELGELEEANISIQRAMSLGSKDPNIIYHRALIEAELGNKDKAIELLAPIVESNIDFIEKKEAEAFFRTIQ